MGDDDMTKEGTTAPETKIGWPILKENTEEVTRNDVALEHPLGIRLPLKVLVRMKRVVERVYHLLDWGEEMLKARGETWRREQEALLAFRAQLAPTSDARVDAMDHGAGSDTGKSLDIATPKSLQDALRISSRVMGVELIENLNEGGATVRVVLELDTRGNTDTKNLMKLYKEGDKIFGPFELSSIEFGEHNAGHRTKALFTLSAILPAPAQKDLEKAASEEAEDVPGQAEELPLIEFEFTPRFRSRLTEMQHLSEEQIEKLIRYQSSANRILKTFDVWESMRILLPKDVAGRGKGNRLVWKGNAALQAVVEHLPGRMQRRLLPELAHQYYRIF